MNLNELPLEIARLRVLGTKDAAYCGLNYGMWLRLSKSGEAPQPIKLTDRKYGWRLEDLQAWVEKQAESAQ
ncbi:helix-turn-helix transcriptional regulator [Methylobacterium oxalidis]|uniref:Uncharacterized protein n=1 Tax=Methylobacterium oxalidis TaxID=944322 RepID=A0A512IX58_9HYPH|nr:AlpA family phage regulatory protein [Methylobacterium oxalidis]GEP02291.1 hypothetical protein MOX02_03290 [Methylobacterium oxalidis]GJE32281.1 hypothetical protein LDDCCGHA_2467 [Methylobacterium oxalidis]GLS62236.1 hypothetical protein GCM10007888_06170 [Methylobacterium oxalidis]